MYRAMLPAFLIFAMTAPGGAAPVEMKITPVNGAAQNGYLELRGVAAGPFNPKMWQSEAPLLLPDIRHPLLEPRQGAARNIYAPSPVQVPGGWRVFYGAWDGVPTGNDRIYSAFTPDFITFSGRHTVIEHGPFIHVCNVNALRLDDGSFAMVCTAYPDADGLNKPVFFTSPDGRTWNGSPEPYAASPADIISINGYDKYRAADINGMNVILHENGQYRLYFGNFQDFGKVYTATSPDGKNYQFGGKALEGAYAVNDVRKFVIGEKPWYLMGVHWNQDKLWYALSNQPDKFDAANPLCSNLDASDRYIVALGWVLDGAQEREGRRLLGVLYGAGASSGLAENRIFARWLQKKAVLVTEDGARVQASRALGPDRQLIPLTEAVSGRLELYSEDGKTLLGRSDTMEFRPASALLLKAQPPR